MKINLAIWGICVEGREGRTGRDTVYGGEAQVYYTIDQSLYVITSFFITDAYAEHTKKKLNDALLPLKTKIISLYFSPKVTYPERLYDVKIMKIRAIRNLTLGHL